MSPAATLAREIRTRFHAPNGSPLETIAMNGEVLVRGAAAADVPQIEALRARFGAPVVLLEEPQAVCASCGCSNDQACPGGCVWAGDSLCSRCVLDDEDGPRRPRPGGDEEEGDPAPDDGEEE